MAKLKIFLLNINIKRVWNNLYKFIKTWKYTLKVWTAIKKRIIKIGIKEMEQIKFDESKTESFSQQLI